MARTYTYQGCDNEALWDIIDLVAHIPHALGWPPIDFEQTFRAMMLGVPLPEISGAVLCPSPQEINTTIML